MSKEDFARYSTALRSAWSFKDLIKNVYVPLEGLKDSEEWERANDLDDRLHLIKVPTFGLGALDDLIVDGKCVPEEKVRKSDAPVMIANTTVGGHASFITGRIIPSSWYPVPVVEFLDFMEARLATKTK